MMATEQNTEGDGIAAQKPLLESWRANERMRHVPTVQWMVDKVDGDVRRRLEALCAPVEMLFADDPGRVAADAQLRSVCFALERFAEVARHARGGGHPPNELTRQVTWCLNHVVASLRTLDADLIGRRFPFQTFERSKAEPLYAALLVVLQAIEHLVVAVRAIDSDIDSRLYAHLVTLETPLPEEPMA